MWRSGWGPDDAVGLFKVGPLYVKNHERIWQQVARYKKLVSAYRPKYEECRVDYIEGKIRREQQELMVDGLLGRFLAELDAEAPKETGGDAEGDTDDADE